MIITNEEMKKAKEDHKETDYTSYTNGLDMLKKMGDNGQEWAVCCSQYMKKLYNITIEPEYLMPWFANAIEFTNEMRRQQEKKDNEALKAKEEKAFNDMLG